jgi:Tol biopolymer transport system component
MGEVYRARDSRLDRDVAIKVLPSHLGADADARSRFEREAKAVAALSHPNILAIHDFGRDDASGLSYAAMELLEGETLRARLEHGPLPQKRVVQLGVEMARGLGAAHARGIVHRDIKPENIFLTSDGRVKILDFGLARPQMAGPNDTNTPTNARHTDPGTVLGTIGYMSPEQVKGLDVDHRSDLFSLGCVLHEMATGRRAFDRATPAETMSAILRDDPPDFARDGSGSGAAALRLEPIVRHALEKQPDERFQSARDLAFALQAVADTSGSTSSVSGANLPAAVEGRAPARRVPALVIAAEVGALAGVGGYLAGRQSAGEVGQTSLGTNFQHLTDDAGVETDPAIAPDGSTVAYTRHQKNQTDVYAQRIGGRNAFAIAADPDRNEAAPAFSPEGSQIAFHLSGGQGGIFVAGATGESARRLTDFGFHPAWSPDGRQIVFCTEEISSPTARTSTSALWVVDAAGGAPRKISDGDGVQAAFAPSGDRLVYWAVDTGQRDIFTMPAGGGERVALTSDPAIDWNPRWSADGRSVYFASDRGGAMNIWRMAVDPGSGRAIGAPEPVTASVTGADQPSLSRDGGRMVFRSAQVSLNPAAASLDPATERLGPLTPIFDRSGSLIPTGVSPDGKWLALWNVLDPQEDVFIARPDGSDLRRLTNDAFRDRWPQWSPDGRELAFYSNRTDTYSIWSIRADGSNLRQVAGQSGGNAFNLLYPTFSPKGDRLVASRARLPETLFVDPRRNADQQTPESVAMRLPNGTWLMPNSWSADGRRLAGAVVTTSGAVSGVAVFDVATAQTRQVTEVPTGFASVVWLKDSRRLLFLNARIGGITLVDVDTGKVRDILTDASLGLGIAIAPDGRTIYVSRQRIQSDVWLLERTGPAGGAIK